MSIRLEGLEWIGQAWPGPACAANEVYDPVRRECVLRTGGSQAIQPAQVVVRQPLTSTQPTTAQKRAGTGLLVVGGLVLVGAVIAIAAGVGR